MITSRIILPQHWLCVDTDTVHHLPPSANYHTAHRCRTDTHEADPDRRHVETHSARNSLLRGYPPANHIVERHHTVPRAFDHNRQCFAVHFPVSTFHLLYSLRTLRSKGRREGHVAHCLPTAACAGSTARRRSIVRSGSRPPVWPSGSPSRPPYRCRHLSPCHPP